MFLCSEYFAASARQQPHRGEHQPCAEAHAGDIQRRCSVPAEAGGDAFFGKCRYDPASGSADQKPNRDAEHRRSKEMDIEIKP